MKDWDKAADKAMEKTEAQLAAGLVKLLALDIDELFPVLVDAETVKAYIEKIRRETVHNERIAAVKEAGAILGERLGKVIQKAIFAALLAFICVPANAQEVQLAPAEAAAASPMLDFSSFFMKTRIGYAVSTQGQRNTVIYSAFKRYNPKPGMELLNLNIGYKSTTKRPVVMLGCRADNLDKLIWSGGWSKKHIETAPTPAIEFSLYASSWPEAISGGKFRLPIEAGLIIAAGFK